MTLAPTAPAGTTTGTDLTALLARRRPGHPLESPFYTDPAVFELDMAMIWLREWLFVGVESEVALPGQFMTLSVGRSPIMVLRDGDGVVRGFHNCCRHRGFRLLDAPSGTVKELVSPSLRWTYRLDGSLADAPFMPDGFDKDAHGLKPLHLRLVAGTIFVCLADRAPEDEPYAPAVEAMMQPHHLATAKVALEETAVVHGNWKLAVENSREFCHDVPSHPDPAGTAAFWDRMDGDGMPSRLAEGPGFHAGRLPFVDGAVSTTTDGQPAVALRLGRVPHNDVGSLRTVRFPGAFSHLLGDHAVLVRLLPLGPDATEVSTRWLVNPAAREGRDYDLPRLRKIWSLANEEQAALVERNQAGVNSVGYRPGPCSPTRESGVTRFLDWYCGKLAQVGQEG